MSIKSQKRKSKRGIGKKVVVALILGIIIGTLLFLVIYNACKNENFLEVSLSTCLSISCVICLSFFLAQNQTDKRREKDILLSLLKTIQTIIVDKNAYVIDTETTTRESLTLRNRSINNYLGILDEHKVGFGIDDDVQELKTKFEEYETLIGDHITNMQYLQDSQKELQRPLELMNTCIFRIMFKIH